MTPQVPPPRLQAGLCFAPVASLVLPVWLTSTSSLCPVCLPWFSISSFASLTPASIKSLGVGPAYQRLWAHSPLQGSVYFLQHMKSASRSGVMCRGPAVQLWMMSGRGVKETTHAAKMLMSLSESKYFLFIMIYPTFLRNFVLTALLVISHLWKNGWILN